MDILAPAARAFVLGYSVHASFSLLMAAATLSHPTNLNSTRLASFCALFAAKYYLAKRYSPLSKLQAFVAGAIAAINVLCLKKSTRKAFATFAIVRGLQSIYNALKARSIY